MRNAHLWEPTKFRATRGGLRANRAAGRVAIRSLLVADLLAPVYDRALKRHAKGRLVDLGCGRAPLFERYRTRVDRSVCLDRLPHTAAAWRHLDVVADLDAGIPLQSDSVDALLVTDVLEHLSDPARLWHDAARILRPGGRMILGVPFLYRIHEAPYDYFRYTRFRLEKFCEDHGLAVVDLEPYGGPMAVLLDLLGKNLPGRRLARAFQLLAIRFLRSALGRRLDLRNRELFPLGYCLVAESPRLPCRWMGRNQ